MQKGLSGHHEKRMKKEAIVLVEIYRGVGVHCYLGYMVQLRRWRVLGKCIRGPSDRGQSTNWRRQGTKFGPRYMPPSTRPRDVNCIQSDRVEL